MYAVDVSDSPVITVKSARHEVTFSTDGSSMNPLEGFYATLAGCAAVYAKKACKELGISAEGIGINCRPYSGKGGPATLGRFRTEVSFPAHFSVEQKAAVIESIAHCAVKQAVTDGPNIEFAVVETASA